MELGRFREAEYPEAWSIVLARIISVGDALFQAELPEYGKTALIVRHCVLRDAPWAYRRRGAFNMGEEVCLRVLRVDIDKDFIDLSSTRLSEEDIQGHMQLIHKFKLVFTILRHTCVSLKLNEDSAQQLVKNISWYFDKKFDCPGKALDIFRLALSNASVLEECDIDDNIRDELLRVIKLKVKAYPLTYFTLRSVVKVNCYTAEGIDAIIRALRAGLTVSTPTWPVQIHVEACPEYEITVKTSDKERGIETLRLAQNRIEESIVQSGGSFGIVIPHSVVKTPKDL